MTYFKDSKIKAFFLSRLWFSHRTSIPTWQVEGFNWKRIFFLIGRTHECCTHCCWTGLQPVSDFQHGNIFPLLPPPGSVNIPTPICIMYHKKLPDFTCRQWHNLFGAAREPVARFLFWLLKWKCNNSVGVAAISLPCHKLLWIHTSSPLSGSNIRADSVTFDYSLEGTEQHHNSLISNRWLRSSKGAICTSSCSPVCPGLQTDQRQTGALTVRSTWTIRLQRVSTDSCHVFASWEGVLGLLIRGSHCHLISNALGLMKVQ